MSTSLLVAWLAYQRNNRLSWDVFRVGLSLDDRMLFRYRVLMDHITIRVSNIESSKLFYLAALKPLGYEVYKELDLGDTLLIGLEAPNQIKFWMTTDQPKTSYVHLAWKASDKKQVDSFYTQAIESGGKCNGEPGPRKYKPSDYYAAYVLDPDGNNIEVVFGNE